MSVPVARPRITVVTICRNALSRLEPTVESVLAQNFEGLEYWVIDGASTDGTVEYLGTLAARGVRTMSEPDRGISDAMNKGIQRATGEWVAHLHAGDHYLPGALARVAAEAARHPEADILCAAMIKHEEIGVVTYPSDPAHLALDMTVNHPASWIRREAFERNGGFDDHYRLAMDYELFLRLRRAGCRFQVIDEPLVEMEYGGESERSLLATLRETHAARQLHLTSGFSRSALYAHWLLVRGQARRALQRLGLAGFVRWFRRRFSLLSKR